MNRQADIESLVIAALEVGSLTIYVNVLRGSIGVEIDTPHGTYCGEADGTNDEAIEDALGEALSDIEEVK